MPWVSLGTHQWGDSTWPGGVLTGIPGPVSSGCGQEQERLFRPHRGDASGGWGQGHTDWLCPQCSSVRAASWEDGIS